MLSTVKSHIIDIFCEVIDNYGDIATIYRLGKDLVKRNQTVRILVNNLETFHALVPQVDCNKSRQSIEGIDVIASCSTDARTIYNACEHEILIEAFGCAVSEEFFEGFSSQKNNRTGNPLHTKRLIINLEYLSAEQWTVSYHTKESLTGKPGIRKFFFMPGFSPDSGGIILDDDFLARKEKIESNPVESRKALCRRYGIDPDRGCNSLFVTLFSYRRNLSFLLKDLAARDIPVILFAASGASTQPVDAFLHAKGMDRGTGALTVVPLPFLPQEEYDTLLLSSDINLVRGEDSLIRAIIAGKPFLWHAYLQERQAHMEKVEALAGRLSSFFTDRDLAESMRSLFLSYNDREENSSDFPRQEDFSLFLSRRIEIGEAVNRFSRSVVENGSLADRLLTFIEERMQFEE